MQDLPNLGSRNHHASWISNQPDQMYSEAGTVSMRTMLKADKRRDRPSRIWIAWDGKKLLHYLQDSNCKF